MGAYVNSVLLRDEKLIFVTGIHWIVYATGAITSFVGFLLLFGWSGLETMMFRNPATDKIADVFDVIPLVVTFIGLLLLGTAYIAQISTELAVTNRRVIAKFGFISRTTYELFLNKVEGANVDQSVLGRVLGFGSVLVRGVGSGFSPIHLIANPLQFQRHVLDQVEHYQPEPRHAG